MTGQRPVESVAMKVLQEFFGGLAPLEPNAQPSCGDGRVVSLQTKMLLSVGADPRWLAC